jgi:hypothetical protein
MRWMAFTALLLLAGCLEGADPSGEPTVEGEADDGPGRTGRSSDGGEDVDGGHYTNSFGLVLSPDGTVAVAVGGVTASDCVLFWDTNGADYRIVNGTATMTWAPMTPLADTLALYVTSGMGLMAEGPSPIVLQLEDLQAENWGFGFGGDIPLGNLAAQQEFTIAVDFTYEGELPSPGMGSCSNGFP